MKLTVSAMLLAAGFAGSIGSIRAESAPETTRLVVRAIVPDGPARQAGILVGDVVVSYDGKPVSTLKTLNDLREKITTDSVAVVIGRAGGEMAIRLPSGKMGVFLDEVLPDLSYQSDARVIEGIPKLGWDVGRSNSFFAALEAVARHLGVTESYLDINGISGGAFRLQFHKDWCPSSADPTCGFNAGDVALRALGLEYQPLHIAADSSNRAELRQAILASIDRQIPVIAIDLVMTPEWGIVTGYQNGGAELFCRTFFDRREGYERAEKFPWALYVITGRTEMSDPGELYKKSFAIARRNLSTEKFGDYFSGLAAFDRWIARLVEDDFRSLDSAQFHNACLANAWTYDRLTDDRQNAADYLDKIAVRFPKAAIRLKELAVLYRDESSLLAAPPEVVRYPFDVKSRDEWTDAMRKRQVELLRQARAKEAAALEIWIAVARAVGE